MRNTVVFGRNDDLYVLGGSGDGSVEFVSSDVVSAVISLKNHIIFAYLIKHIILIV